MNRTYDGKALKVLRVMADLTQEQVVEKMNAISDRAITQGAVSGCERGSEPSVKTLFLFGQVYGKTLDEMYEICWPEVA